MNQLFNVDNKFFQMVSKIVDCVYISALWLFCSLPIITAGASTTALYYTVNKSVKNERGYAAAEFFSAFKSNFKQSTIIWLGLIAVYVLLGFDYYAMQKFAEAGLAIGEIYVIFLAFALVVTMWASYIFPYIARFENTTKNVLKNTALMALANAPWTILINAVFIVSFVAIYFMPGVAIVMPVIYNLVKNAMIERVFKKYMTAEDLALEEERNREYYN